jgi:hypothetical protein
MLTLPERLLLISIDDQGKPHDPKSSLGPALAGAALTELLLAGQLRNDDDRVVATTAGPTGEALLDEVVAEIRGEKRPRTLKWWVQRLASRHRGRKPRGVPEVGRLSCCAFVFVDEAAEDVTAVEVPRCG